MNTQEKINLLNSLKGRFSHGHTDDDIESVSEDLEKIFSGFRLVCVWAFEDMWGFGGDSQIYAEENGDLYEFPEDLYSWLYFDGTDQELRFAPQHLLNSCPGKRARKPKYRETNCNWSWRRDTNKDLD